MKAIIKKDPKEKILYLEGLRGLAMTMVVLNHFAAVFYPAIIFGKKAASHNFFELLIYETPMNIFFSGIFALSIFFLLSGYFLSYKYFKFHQREPIISSMIKRYLRLVIPILVSMLIAYTFLKLGLFYNHSVASLTGSSMWFANFWSFEANILNAALEGLFFTSIFKGNSTYNPVLWMMGYEFAGSLLVYITLILFKFSRNKVIVYFLLIFITWKSYLLAFVLGVLICDLEHRSIINIFKYRYKIIGVLLLVLAVYFGSFPIASTKDTIYDFIKIPLLSDDENVILFHTVAACLVFLAIKSLDKFKRLLGMFIFRFLGGISFSVFFLHLIIIGSFSSYLFKIFIKFLSYNQSVLITFLVTFPAILVISYFFNKYITLNSLRIANAVKSFVSTKYNI